MYYVPVQTICIYMLAPDFFQWCSLLSPTFYHTYSWHICKDTIKTRPHLFIINATPIYTCRLAGEDMPHTSPLLHSWLGPYHKQCMSGRSFSLQCASQGQRDMPKVEMRITSRDTQCIKPKVHKKYFY